MDSPLGLWASSTLTSLVLPSGTQPKPFSHSCTINLFLPSLINKSLVSASSIFLQPLTPSTTPYYLKDCPPGSILLTRLSSGFSPIFLLTLSPSKHLKHHPNHALSPVVFRKVQFSGPFFSSFTLLHLVHSSKHPQSTIIYTLMTPNYSSLSLQTASLTPYMIFCVWLTKSARG